ncbi:MAG: FGGY-family carbohydrate kinase [Planctomycetota bacterium]|nr:FGGY-family carbohydrate kinase [Planctomycetota bacterium]
MAKTAHHFLALDLGAESGRGELVTLADDRAAMEEIHRFANRPVRMAGTLYWDLPALFAEVLAAMRTCAERSVKLSGIGVDTWGLDFGLLTADGELLGNPVHYRDGRTENIYAYSDPIMSRAKIFERTGYEPWPINSLFQLLSMQRDGSPALAAAEMFLNMPDLLLYFLTGRAACELSIINTSDLLATDCTWAEDIMERFSLPRKMFPPLIPPATVLGKLTAEVRDATGLGDVPVIASCGHDTSAAVAAVPGEGENWAFISCGTWSVLGELVSRPVITPQCLQLGFTNEYTVGGWYLARNIYGLWLVQQLRKKWDSPQDGWDYVRMTAEADRAKTDCLVDAADDSLMVPPDMEAALLKLISDSGQTAPAGRGELVRCVLESLALEYDRRLDALAELTGRRAGTVYMVGGGINNKLLCQLTADACGVEVRAGADQCTALGNALSQALAVGILKSPDDIRQVVRQSCKMSVYQPADQDVWRQKRMQYRRLTEER